MADPNWERGNEHDVGYYVHADGTLRSQHDDTSMESPTKSFAQKKHLKHMPVNNANCEYLWATNPATQSAVAMNTKMNLREIPDDSVGALTIGDFGKKRFESMYSAEMPDRKGKKKIEPPTSVYEDPATEKPAKKVVKPPLSDHGEGRPF
jgi:hypothetical protein